MDAQDGDSRHQLHDWVPGCLWWRRPTPGLRGDGHVSMEVAEFTILGINADGVNVYTVTVAPTMVKAAFSCPDTDSGMAWVTREVQPEAFASLSELVRELTS